jgi:hypothetical protein
MSYVGPDLGVDTSTVTNSLQLWTFYSSFYLCLGLHLLCYLHWHDSSAQDESIIKDSNAHDYSQGYSHNDGHGYNAQDDSPVTDTDSNTGQLDY